MTKEISKEVKPKVYGLYLGAEVKTPDGTGIMHTVCQSGHIYAKCEGMQTEEYALYECQLILSDLSDISDEDLIDVSRVAGLSDDEIYSFDNINEESKKAWAANIDDLLYPMADFLRSRGYMLPAHGITDLFEAGIAVRKNKEV